MREVPGPGEGLFRSRSKWLERRPGEGTGQGMDWAEGLDMKEGRR